MGLLDDAIREHLDLKRRRGADPADVERLEREALGPVRRGPAPVEAGGEAVAEGERGFLDEPQDGLAPAAAEQEHWEEDEHWDDLPAGAEYERSDEQQPAFGYDSPAAYESLPEREASGPPPVPAEPWDDEEEDGSIEAVRPVEFERRSLRDRLGRRDVPFHEDEEPDDLAAGATPAPHPAAAPPPEPELPPHLDQQTVEYQALEHEEGLAGPPEPVREPGSPNGPEPGQEPRGEEILEETPEFLQDTPDHDRLWFEQRPPRDFDFDE